jgi:hypothetical protein
MLHRASMLGALNCSLFTLSLFTCNRFSIALQRYDIIFAPPNIAYRFGAVFSINSRSFSAVIRGRFAPTMMHKALCLQRPAVGFQSFNYQFSISQFPPAVTL